MGLTNERSEELRFVNQYCTHVRENRIQKIRVYVVYMRATMRSLPYLTSNAVKLLISLISRLVACSARIVADKQTDTQNDYIL